MSAEQIRRDKIKRIVELAERQFPDGEYADRASDAVREDPQCDEQTVATRLAMEIAFP